MSEMKAAGIIPFRVRKEGPEFLLLRAFDHGTWGFPKGIHEPGETEESASRREFGEETGLAETRSIPGFRQAFSYKVDVSGEVRDKTAVYFLGEVKTGEVSLSAEHDRFAWLPAPKAMERIHFENLRETFARAVIAVWREPGHPAHPVSGRERLRSEEAEAVLFSLGSAADRWIRHNMKVGEVAEKIGLAGAAAGLDLDPSFLAGAGILHDVGRALDHDLHGWEGYRLLTDLGLPAYARVCVVHWLKGRDAQQMKSDGFRDEGLIEELDGKRRFRPLSPDERALCVADALVAGDRLVSVEERFARARERYGDTPWMRRNESLSLAWLRDIEGGIGVPLLPLLAGKGGS